MANEVRITVSGGRISVESPYHPEFPSRAKLLGGRWDSGTRQWTFDARDEERVRALCTETYGTDGTDTEMVTVRMALDSNALDGQTVRLGGREVLHRPSRDADVRLGQGVVLVDGVLPDRGGSARYPIIGGRGVTVEVRDIPAALFDTNTMQLVSDTETAATALRQRIAALEAELAEARQQLAALER